MTNDDARARWDLRHGARDLIEAPDPDPTLVAACAGLSPGPRLADAWSILAHLRN